LAGRCGASVKSRNTATAQKNPAFGGPNRPTGFVAALARYPVSRVAPRLPGCTALAHRIDSL
ncbi:MAG: hypothetical protein Q8P46_16320, partial [Hyphomicrobiales bacterium]|nr:hypothetical protein [Hyphomicrobiales bacterium]